MFPHSGAGFEDLAYELVLEVLKQAPDLESLHSLLLAAPTAYRVFDRFAVEIVNAILPAASFPGRSLHEHVRVIMRVITHIHTGSLPAEIDSLYKFMQLVTEESQGYRLRPSLHGFRPSSFPAEASSCVLRYILATSFRIASLTHDCLEFYLARFRELRPRRLKDGSGTAVCQLGTEDWATETLSHDVVDYGQPSWVEQQRVLRALWRIQLLVELKRAVKNSTLVWDRIEAETLDKMKLTDLYGYYRDQWPVDATLSPKADAFSIQCCEPSVPQNHAHVEHGYFFRSFRMAEYQLLLTAQDYLARAPVHAGRKIAKGAGPPAFHCLSKSHTVGIVNKEDVEALWDWRLLCTNWSEATHVLCDVNRQSAHFLDFFPFRRLGFAIWCEKRLQMQGLLNMDDESPDATKSTPAAWLSILRPCDEQECRAQAEASRKLNQVDYRMARYLLPEWSERDF
ncbi:hypothetical protein ANO11243_096880 [Dothideomycetidae sp. 11243]|nr:hypothetical protein ANO11243_096880 [fungal sp. No.11243]